MSFVLPQPTLKSKNLECNTLKCNNVAVNNLTASNLGTSVVISESSTQSTPASGKGKLWVRDDSPNVLIFTNDEGTELELGGGGGGGLGDVLEVTQTGSLVDDVDIVDSNNAIITLFSAVDPSSFEGDGPNFKVLSSAITEASIITLRLYGVDNGSDMALDAAIDTSHNPGVSNQSVGEVTINLGITSPATLTAPKIRIIIE